MAESVIETLRLTKLYGGRPSVKDLDLQVSQGEVYGFLGPNGAGKTTTIKMLLGLVKPTKGHVRIFGKEMGKERKIILRITGSLVDSPTYYGHLSGRDNLKIITRILDLPEKKIDKMFYPFFASMPIMALQLWLSMVIRNQAIPLTIGIIGAMVSLFLGYSPSSLLQLLPWAYVPLSSPVNEGDYAQWPLAGMGLGLVLFLAGGLHFSKHELQ
ncbi:ATP-binding cassette domain-containing protein [Paludifilum halophilum]|uniref:ABC transporter domain-containing protein n=1 Tax=Paludifilum halophilum TaxID=1642702 RepID=A0A235B932_9BACL|nr:ATP-binding cassette domain-containing protein [Paludifilum halophilum]OYD08105.1 hypothetical protein CHM34_08325 [Paludifilum halophilum]